MEWISVKDRKPIVDDIVLVAIYYPGMGNNWKDWHVGVSHRSEYGCWITHFGCIEKDDAKIKVTHWMPLPKPPEE